MHDSRLVQRWLYEIASTTPNSAWTSENHHSTRNLPRGKKEGLDLRRVCNCKFLQLYSISASTAGTKRTEIQLWRKIVVCQIAESAQAQHDAQSCHIVLYIGVLLFVDNMGCLLVISKEMRQSFVRTLHLFIVINPRQPKRLEGPWISWTSLSMPASNTDLHSVSSRLPEVWQGVHLRLILLQPSLNSYTHGMARSGFSFLYVAGISSFNNTSLLSSSLPIDNRWQRSISTADVDIASFKLEIRKIGRLMYM